VPALPLGMGLGVWPDLADAWGLAAGATLLFYTDGLSEARDKHGVFYDPAVRLRGRIFPGPDELLSALTDDVRQHTGGKSTDDMALVAVVRPAEGQPERRRTVKIVRRGRE
jgi:serine phosphatase RsbU (regulator of sigma subunit)